MLMMISSIAFKTAVVFLTAAVGVTITWHSMRVGGHCGGYPRRRYVWLAAS